jgi:hypothetical protein
LIESQRVDLPSALLQPEALLFHWPHLSFARLWLIFHEKANQDAIGRCQRRTETAEWKLLSGNC